MTRETVRCWMCRQQAVGVYCEALSPWWGNLSTGFKWPWDATCSKTRRRNRQTDMLPVTMHSGEGLSSTAQLLGRKTLCDDEQRNESKFEAVISLSFSLLPVHTAPLKMGHSDPQLDGPTLDMSPADIYYVPLSSAKYLVTMETPPRKKKTIKSKWKSIQKHSQVENSKSTLRCRPNKTKIFLMCMV